MSATTPSQGEIRDYLLRRLPESRRSRLEELYFRDDRLLDRVEEAEDQLVSDYVLGRLSPADRKLFEDSLLGTPYYRERIETTTQMRLRLSRHRAFARGSRKQPGLLPGRTGLLVAASLLFVLFVAALASALRLKRELEALTSAAAPPGRSDPPARVLVLAGPAADVPAPLRSLPADARPLLLVLPRTVLPRTASSWRLSLRSGSGTVWTSGAIRPGSDGEGDHAIRLPPGMPAPGRYDVVAAEEGDPASVRTLATLEVAAEGR